MEPRATHRFLLLAVPEAGDCKIYLAREQSFRVLFVFQGPGKDFSTKRQIQIQTTSNHHTIILLGVSMSQTHPDTKLGRDKLKKHTCIALD